eukprot:1329177-Alexandrium_andersonii.AAC.1
MAIHRRGRLRPQGEEEEPLGRPEPRTDVPPPLGVLGSRAHGPPHDWSWCRTGWRARCSGRERPGGKTQESMAARRACA